jgi:diacylglycerol kinase (ATP)
MSTGNMFVVINARIGEQKIQRILASLDALRNTIAIDVQITQYAGHAGLLSAEAVANGYQTIVAAGGDGTVNEVIQSIAGTSCGLAVIPCGSGNGLARHCSIPLVIEEAVALLASGKQIKIDLGLANGVYFISNAGVGFDAVVCHAIQQLSKRGLWMYIRQVIHQYFFYTADTYTIEVNGETFSQQAFMLNVANGKEFGYGFEIAPEASLQDGKLDMILVKKMGFFSGITFVIDGWRKRLHRNKNCMYIRAERIALQGARLHFFQTDGDAHNCQGHCHIEVAKGALHLLVPEHIKTL